MNLLEMLEKRERIGDALRMLKAAEKICKQSGRISKSTMDRIHQMVLDETTSYNGMTDRINARRKAIRDSLAKERKRRWPYYWEEMYQNYGNP